MTLRTHEITAVFAGIGGMELGLHRGGHRTSLFCECDAEAHAVLNARFPDLPIVDDVRRIDELTANISPRSDLLTAGFPCTDLSQAGTTKGFAGGRSSLIRETLEILRRRPFPNVLIENVPNWRHLHGGAYLREVIEELECLGYSWAYRTLDARAFGSPQRRNRIFLFATLESDPREVLFHGNFPEEHRTFALDEAAHGFYWTEGSKGLGWGEDCIPTLKGGSSIGIPAAPAILRPDFAVVTPELRDGERLQGFPENWTNLERLAPKYGDRIFNQRRRWMLVGNAVHVDVSSWIGSNLAKRRPFAGEPGERVGNGEAWPQAAWYDGKVRRRANLTAWPVRSNRSPLASFLRFPGKPLSLRATSGFLSRAERSRLNFVPGFLEALRRHMERMEAIEGKSRTFVKVQPIAARAA